MSHTMRTFIATLFIVAVCFSVSAQEAVEAFAQKDDTYLLFSDKGFDKQKKYVLFNFWNADTPHADVHNTEFQAMRQNFVGHNNIEFVDVEWETEKDIQAVLEKYQVESSVEYGKNIRLKGDQFTLNTSSTNAFFLVEDSKAAFLCSGAICGKKVKQFFNPENGK